MWPSKPLCEGSRYDDTSRIGGVRGLTTCLLKDSLKLCRPAAVTSGMNNAAKLQKIRALMSSPYAGERKAAVSALCRLARAEAGTDYQPGDVLDVKA